MSLHPCVALCRRLSILVLALLMPLAAGAESPPAPVLAERYHDGVDPRAYLVSEKLDGVRALWDGERLRFRSGRELLAPAWFTAPLPRQPLDGELWLGRGRFEALSGIVRRQLAGDEAWREVRYMIFELPGAEGDFSARAARIRELVAEARTPWLQAVPQFRLADRKAVQRKLDEIVAAGGEGLMLHRADAPWVAGRSEVLLKLTPWLDAEARVVAHVPGKGRLQGMVGALEVEDESGRHFRIGSGLSDELRRLPPALGSRVTYRYRELTAKGLPRFPRYLRERPLTE
ncbi:DNA ligase [Azoarcus indigens]|uniref:DNA ligase-1 n=1 Tax=Azoarcus indigens TaxID=29545 RepID=A0A4R6DUY4_9RHOO|nr:DNA ligase [Azoarcus indigens]NMG65074.1 DNA ligase [Azoarcus indigens]TDN48967.1 DNA ligase-1 [Azoarcus indigens]